MPEQQPDPEQHITDQVKVLTEEREALEQSQKDGQLTEPEFMKLTSRIDFQLAQIREGAQKEALKEEAQEHGRQAAVQYERRGDRFGD